MRGLSFFPKQRDEFYYQNQNRLCPNGRRLVLHIVDADTKYGTAIFVKSISKNPATAEVWEAFAHAWALTYTGITGTIQTDRGTQFASQEFNLLLEAHVI